jgi:hypothetical protein
LIERLKELQFPWEYPMIYLQPNDGKMVENFHPPIPDLHDDQEQFLDVVGTVINTEIVEFMTCIDLGMSLGAQPFFHI